jgi:hypothetical protein
MRASRWSCHQRSSEDCGSRECLLVILCAVHIGPVLVCIVLGKEKVGQVRDSFSYAKYLCLTQTAWNIVTTPGFFSMLPKWTLVPWKLPVFSDSIYCCKLHCSVRVSSRLASQTWGRQVNSITSTQPRRQEQWASSTHPTPWFLCVSSAQSFAPSMTKTQSRSHRSLLSLS